MIKAEKLKNAKPLPSPMVPSTEDNGKGRQDMDMEFRYGKMVQSMKDFGKMIKLTGKGNFIMLKVIFMKVNGLKIKFMVMVYILMLLALNMKATGRMICRTDME